MTYRFYPLGKQSAEDVWKTSYEIQNEMRSFQRSAYPPGYAGHEPGAREKFGFSTPGPDAHRLTASHLCLREDTDIQEPRRNLALSRTQINDAKEDPEDELKPYRVSSKQLETRFVLLADGGAQHSVELAWAGSYGKLSVAATEADVLEPTA